MDPQILRGGFRIGMLVLGLALLMLPFQARDSAEFVVTVLAAIVGGAFVLGIAFLARSANPPLPHAGTDRKGYNNKRSTGGGQ
jgi:hypothetical protein